MTEMRPTTPAPLPQRAPEPALLRMHGMRKSFGTVVALDGVDFEVAPRQVHGLLGGNGAGKTTLMNVLYGLYRPDSGAVEIDGQQVHIRSPRDAIRHGVGMVHQSFLQVDTYTVTENIVLGTRLPSFPVLSLHDAHQRVREMSERFGLDVDPGVRVEDLSVGLRQRVEILKALYRGARLLVLDEPTTNLTPHEVDALFGSLRAIVEEGMSVVFITHKIRETLAVCDRLTVMRDGRLVTVVDRDAVDARRLAGLMVGELSEAGEEIRDDVAAVIGREGVEEADALTPSSATTTPRMVAQGVCADNDLGVEAVHGVSLTVHRGEILGVAGVAGNGQGELVEVLSGIRTARSGSIELDGSPMAGQPTARWLAAGVAYVPEDRTRDGILPTSSIAENIVLGAHRSPRFRRRGFIDSGAVRRTAATAMSAYSIKASSVNSPAGELSGGNIQRVILARVFGHDPNLLVLHNPTRGLDIRSTQFVYERVREAAAADAAVLLVSEDLDELMHLADRVVAVYSGRIVGEQSRGAYNPYEIGRLMTGVRGEV